MNAPVTHWRIDLLDTSTRPTPAMREAMAEAEVGDDVYRNDPTVNRLEAEAAASVGKEAALFVPSGTMGNLVALLAQTSRGDEVLLEAESHIYYYEAGGLATVAGLMPRLIEGHRGVLDPDRVRAAIRPQDVHFPRPRLLCVENTHNRAGGTVTPPETVRALSELCREYGLAFHMDGARVFNAAAALDLPVSAFTEHVDTVMFCLSKGLGAPVGSLLAGDQATIDAARRARKMLGGGMRQAGVLAAAGLIALREGPKRLVEDHRLTRLLAEKLSAIAHLDIDPAQVQTNMVIVDLLPSGKTAAEVAEKLSERGIHVSTRPPYRLRMVVHREITATHIDEVATALADILAQP